MASRQTQHSLSIQRRARTWLSALAAVFLSVFWCATALAQPTATLGPRHAILIGNSSYVGIPALRNPINDVRALAGVLAEMGFEIHLLEDSTLENKRRFIDETTASLPEDATVFFYFAGHALQRNGLNWLLPTDFTVPPDFSVEGVAIGIDEILNSLDDAGVGLKIVVLDACRDFPLGDAEDVFGDGLADVAAQGETLIAYATTAGALAQDGTGPNSPFAGALVSALSREGLELYDVFRLVRSQVREATDGQQLPWVSGSIESRVVLREGPPQFAQEAAPEVVEPLQAVHWQSISSSVNPNDFLQFASLHIGTPAGELAVQRAAQLVQEGATLVPRIEVQVEQPADGSFVVTPCDVWVSDPEDPDRLADGVPRGLVNVRDAIRDCSIALANDRESARLTFLLGRALEVAERFDDARRFYERAIELGYPMASVNLGIMYRNGLGVEPDDARAASLYQSAAEDGIQLAQVALARLYQEGWGVPQSYPDTLRWLNLLEAQNYPRALDHLGNLHRNAEYVEQDFARAFELYRRASDQGHSNSTANLARMYRDGLGVEEDWHRAVELYSIAVQQGNPFAPYHLAGMLVDPPEGVPPDPQRARAMLDLSIERGFAWATWRLARYLNSDLLGPRDVEEAVFYLHVAEAAGAFMRREDAIQLQTSAAELRAELEAELPQAAVIDAATRARDWLAANGVFGFSLIYRY